MPLAIREIALNTRRDREQGSRYTLIRILSICMKIFAVMIWAGGVALIVYLGVTGSLPGGLFANGPRL